MKDARSYAIELRDKTVDLIAAIESGDTAIADEIIDEFYVILEDVNDALQIQEEN